MQDGCATNNNQQPYWNVINCSFKENLSPGGGGGGQPYHEDDAQHGQPAAQVGGGLPLKVHPAVGRELEGDSLDLPPGGRERGLHSCARLRASVALTRAPYRYGERMSMWTASLALSASLW